MQDREDTDTRLDPVIVEAYFPRGPEHPWQVLSLRGSEAISTPYEFELELHTDDPTAAHEELIGADCEILLDRVGVVRSVHGVVAAVELVTRSEAQTSGIGLAVRVRVVPALRMLEQVVATRFFAGQTVPEILREVLAPALADYDRELDGESWLRAEYSRRDYCVQFRESSLAFCSRLMEEEGIAYLFVPDEEAQREKLVLIDNNEDFPEAELLVPDAVPIVLHQPEECERESVQALDWRTARTPNRVIARGYNSKIPEALDEGCAERAEQPRHVTRTVELDGERRQIIDDPLDDPKAESFTGAELAQRGPLATRTLQCLALEAARGVGRSNAVGFAVGRVFDLGDHPSPALSQRKYLLVAATHEASRAGHSALDGHLYENHFECIPHEQPFRPALVTPRPRAYGVQTGVVIGRVNDEVHTDQFGRVRVRLHPARGDDRDEHASCWIPVAQSWAGAGYGAIVLPRVGMEVVVSFVDANPDCPIVTGCVYNGANAPPHALPAELTRTSFKTRSSPGGEGFNELCIEDAAGSERIFVHAQRRMDLRVRGILYETAVGGREEQIGPPRYGSWVAHNTLVHGEVNHHVRSSRYTAIGHRQHTSVSDDLVEDLQGRHMVLVGELSQLSAPTVVVEASGNISHKANTLELAGSETISVKAGGKLTVESHNAIELKVGGSFISISPEGIDIQGVTVRLNSGGGTGSASEGQSALPVEILDPIDALAAWDGRCRGGGAGSSEERTRTHDRRTLEPHHAPPMKPPPKPRHSRRRSGPVVYPKGHPPIRVASLTWLSREVYCSDYAQLEVLTAGEGEREGEVGLLINSSDGAAQRSFITALREDGSTETVEIIDVLPRETMTGHESERWLLASVDGVTTSTPLRLRFLTSIARTWHREGFSQFELAVEDAEVVVGGVIHYVRGWLFEIVSLGETVPEGTGGLIGTTSYGSRDWRYSMWGDDGQRLYWDGDGWSPVPAAWSETDSNRYPIGVWSEQGKTRTRGGTLPWPGPTMVWDEHLAQYCSEILNNKHRREIDTCWSRRFDIKRQDCRSHDPRCCRYRVRCQVEFREAETLPPDGIVVQPNSDQANSTLWALWPTENLEGQSIAAHEFGHHLGNPDEYEGAATVDPSVNGDGAVAGIDEDSIMGSGTVVRRRHYQTICEVMSELVARRTGRTFTYVPVPVLEP